MLMNGSRLIIAFAIAALCQHAVAVENASAVNDARRVFKSASRSVVLIEASPKGNVVQGSGVAFRNGASSKGRLDRTWIVTNAHVVRGERIVNVRIDGSAKPAKVEFVDDDFDLALLNLADSVLPVVTPDSSNIEIGQRVYTVGSPLGLENSVSEGIVSGKRQRSGISLIQTTAPISPGNSGGGLFDTSGRFIGITTFKLSGGENLNFAVDSSYAIQMIDALSASLLPPTEN